MADIARAGPSGSDNQSMYQRVDEALTNFFGPINRAAEGVMGPANEQWKKQLPFILMTMGAKAGPSAMPGGARYIGMPRRMQAQTNRNDPFDFTTVPVDRYRPQGVVNMARQVPDYPSTAAGAMPRTPMPPGGPSNPVGPPSRDLILQALQQRANRGSNMPFLQQSRMEQSSAMPLNMQAPANMSTSPAGMNAQDTFRQALMRQLLGGQ